ncbi:MAG: hypothetical protein HC868_03630 [Sphingomonadales bacterium]|nr:hypothetical protein [Sphingomonadales bacterium]
MARLTVKDKVSLGKFIIEAAQDEKLRAALLDDMQSTQLLEKYVELPDVNHKIKVHPDTAGVTVIVLPTAEDVKGALDKLDNLGMYPDQYRPDSPDYIDDKEEPLLALQFRFGEYTFGRCKH